MKLKADVNGVWVSQATKSGFIFCEWGGCFDMSYPNSKLRRGRVLGKGHICPTLTETIEIMVINKR